MSSPGEITLEVMMFVFIICSFIGCVGCTSALLKKCYDKCIADLPDEQEQSIVTIQNVEFGYANATASVVIPTVLVDANLLEPHSNTLEEEESSISIIAVQVV
jgi:hypothetical protein